ncbi:N-acetylmuramoyl-L-alanine amidase [Massilia sp. CF038]|uniref:N-acetylmuramoyl-L-alanine amidase n=1 Tax=Massilia sp. CF038 TaxID=1881045 RepID=UPI000934D0CA|nr:N-acetylmuramoyl-L-alanine amidase [Massilia sp. CF038]
MKKPTLIALCLLALLTGCASGPQIDRSFSAKGQSSRVKFVVLHYTVSNTPGSLRTLTQEVVSSHYLVTDDAKPVVYGLVDENRQSNHAGVSSWKNYTLLNGSSIGIEIVNPGFTKGPEGRIWHPFPQAQIDRVIALVKDIVARHQIPPENILGHADIAPMRKQDPGPLFPWIQLAQQGLVTWPDALKVAALRPQFELAPPDTAWFQKKLAGVGYTTPQNGELDAATRASMVAFQMKYRPSLFDGSPDAETAALLETLVPTPPPPPAPPVPTMSPALAVPVAPAATAAPATPPAPAVPAPVPDLPAVPVEH